MIYLRSNGYICQEVARLVRVDADTVTAYQRKYRDSGLLRLLAENYSSPRGRLDGQRLQPSACRRFLHKLGLKPRRCGLVPGKVLDDGEKQEFHDQKLQPMLKEAKQASALCCSWMRRIS